MAEQKYVSEQGCNLHLCAVDKTVKLYELRLLFLLTKHKTVSPKPGKNIKWKYGLKFKYYQNRFELITLMLTQWWRQIESFFSSKFGAKEEVIVGGCDDIFNGDWTKDKMNYVIGQSWHSCGTKVGVAVQKYRLRCKKGFRCKKKVWNKSWTGLNNVEKMDKNRLTHMGNRLIFGAHNY